MLTAHVEGGVGARRTAMRNCGALLDFDELRERLGLRQQAYAGVHPIPVANIVGSAGRCCDFDRCFHALREPLRMRTRSVRAAFPDGQFPPITVFRIDRAYFVEDGHHRVAVTRALGMEFVDAVVTEVKSTYRFDEHLGSEDVALLEAEHDFRARTGLATARPDTRFTLSSPAGYVDLAETVRSHGYELSLTAGDVVPRTQVAAHWHDCVYQPLLDELVARGCRDLLAAASDAELFLAVYRTQAALQASAADGCAAFVEAARATAASMERPKVPALERLRAVARGPAGKRWGVLRRALRRARPRRRPVGGLTCLRSAAPDLSSMGI